MHKCSSLLVFLNLLRWHHDIIEKDICLLASSGLLNSSIKKETLHVSKQLKQLTELAVSMPASF